MQLDVRSVVIENEIQEDYSKIDEKKGCAVTRGNKLFYFTHYFYSRAKWVEPYKCSSVSQCPGLISSPILWG